MTLCRLRLGHRLCSHVPGELQHGQYDDGHRHRSVQPGVTVSSLLKASLVVIVCHEKQRLFSCERSVVTGRR